MDFKSLSAPLLQFLLQQVCSSSCKAGLPCSLQPSRGRGLLARAVLAGDACSPALCSGFSADSDTHAGDSSRAASADDPCRDCDGPGGAAEAHTAAGGDHGLGPTADPRRPQLGPGAGQLRQPEPAAQAADARPCCEAEDAHQAPLPVGGRRAPACGKACPPRGERSTVSAPGVVRNGSAWTLPGTSRGAPWEMWSSPGAPSWPSGMDVTGWRSDSGDVFSVVLPFRFPPEQQCSFGKPCRAFVNVQ